MIAKSLVCPIVPSPGPDQYASASDRTITQESVTQTVLNLLHNQRQHPYRNVDHEDLCWLLSATIETFTGNRPNQPTRRGHGYIQLHNHPSGSEVGSSVVLERACVRERVCGVQVIYRVGSSLA